MLYLAQIEEIFSKVRGVGLVLSPLNWVIAERWEQMGIPLSIISKGIKKSCRRLRAQERRVDILTYCEPRIFALWKEYKQNLIGAPKPSSEKEHYEKTYQLVINKIRSIRNELDVLKIKQHQWPEVISITLSRIEYERILKEIEQKAESDFLNSTIVDIECIENSLAELDNRMIEIILDLLPHKVKEYCMQEIERTFEGYREHMEKDVYEESVTMSLKNLIRERLKLKRISLYAT